MKFLLAMFFFLCLLAFPSKILADENFSTSVDTTYTISDSGNTHVLIQATIQNNTGKLFPSMYAMELGFTDIKNPSAYDKSGALNPSISTGKTFTKIAIPLVYRADGIGAKDAFTVSFDTLQVAKKNGLIWEITTPGIANQADFKDFNTHIRVPQDFGNPSYIKPAQIGNNLDFDKTTTGSSGINVAFGLYQSYNFSLTYHLKNSGFFTQDENIAIPPTTNYQFVSIDSISPAPLNVIEDKDGNWLAVYSLSPSQNIDVSVIGRAKVMLNPEAQSLSEGQKKALTNQDIYWETRDSQIEKLGQELKTPRAIFDYVVNNLKYDYSRIAGNQVRLGAKKILENPSQAVCLEFSDLFVALSRAAGIPSREIDGFAYTNNNILKPISGTKDILHTWAEYYDPDRKTWVMVDPTWENTTNGIDYFDVFDFDHIAFAVKGAESVFPLPAGSYKTSPRGKKDVSVSFGAGLPRENPQLSVLIDIPPKAMSGFPISGNLVIKNSGKDLLPQQKINVFSSYLKPSYSKLSFPEIPPLGFVKIPITFEGGRFLTKNQEVITIAISGNKITRQVSLVAFFVESGTIYKGAAFGLFCIIIFIITSKARRLPFFRKRR